MAPFFVFTIGNQGNQLGQITVGRYDGEAYKMAVVVDDSFEDRKI